MRRLALLAFAMFMVAGVSFAAENSIVGTWEAESEGGHSLKIYSETHWANVAVDKDGAFRGAAAGEYVLTGDTVTEKVQRSSNPDYVGKEATLECSISADTLTCSVKLPTGETNEEIWKRVK